MKVSKQRILWRKRVAELLESGLPVKTWCAINGIDYSMMYRWLSTFKEQEPDVLGGYEIAHAGDGDIHWFECVMEAYAQRGEDGKPDGCATAMAPVGFATVELIERPEDEICVGPSYPQVPYAGHRRPRPAPVTVFVDGITVLIGNDAEGALIEAVMRGALRR